MGTPEFAVPTLEILYNAGYDIAGVITSTDKWGGRGRKVKIESAVKKFAQLKGINILQPPNLKNKQFVEELRSLKADLQIVVAFRMLPEVVWNMPPLGTYNLHGSLLPKYRGAAPINWSIINGDQETGVTSFKLKHEIDTGSIAIQKRIKIYPSDNATAVHDRMKFIAADVIYETVKGIELGQIDLHAQEDTAATHAPKLNPDNTKIDFSKSAQSIHNLIRGLSQYPCAWFNLTGKKIKVYKSNFKIETHSKSTGTVETDQKSYFKIYCKDGSIYLDELQMTGKKKMSVKDWLNGYTVDLNAEAN